MSAECPACPTRRSRLRTHAPRLGAASGALALLAPKCPLCVSGWLLALCVGIIGYFAAGPGTFEKIRALVDLAVHRSSRS